MLVVSLSIAPIFGLIILGYCLRRGGIPSFDFWQINDKLVYWVLMPSLLFYKTSTATYDISLVTSYALVIIGAFSCSVLFALLCSKILGLSGPTSSTVLQGAARHNTFIAIAVAEKLYGVDGLALAALASAMLIPITNLTIVPSMVLIISGSKNKSVISAVVRDLIRNPLLIAVAIGITVNYLAAEPVPVLHDMTRILGAAALPIMLLCVGASLQLGALSNSTLAVTLAIIGKMFVFPIVTFAIAQWVGLTQIQTMVALLFAAAPTASASYTLSRQLGGDAPAMAAIITIQIALTFITLPLTVFLAQYYLLAN